MAVSMVYMAMPRNSKLQAAIGRVAVRHGQLDFILRMTIKSIREISPKEARKETARVMSGKLRERVENLARKRFGDGPALRRLQELLERCRRTSDERNMLLHGVFARELDGPDLFMGDGDPGPLPKVRELNALAKELDDLTNELNHARFEGGFIYEAIKQSKPIKAG